MARLTITLETHEGEDAGRVIGDILAGVASAISKPAEPVIETRTIFMDSSPIAHAANGASFGPLARKMARLAPEEKTEETEEPEEPEPPREPDEPTAIAPIVEEVKRPRKKPAVYVNSMTVEALQDELGGLKAGMGRLHSDSPEYKTTWNRIQACKKELQKRGAPLDVISTFGNALGNGASGALKGRAL